MGPPRLGTKEPHNVPISSFAEDTGARACNNHVNKGAFAIAKKFERFYIISKHERACSEVHGEKLNDLNSCKHTPSVVLLSPFVCTPGQGGSRRGGRTAQEETQQPKRAAAENPIPNFNPLESPPPPPPPSLNFSV